MTHQGPVTKRSPRKGVVLGGALLALLVVVYFVFFFPPTPAEDATGAIGAAEKYRAEQITDEDVILAEQSTVVAEADAVEIADAQMVGELQRSAASFDRTAKAFQKQFALEKAAAFELNRAAAAFSKAAKASGSYSFAKAASANMLDRVASFERNLKATESLDKAAAAELSRSAQALALQATALNLEATARALEKAQSLDKAAAYDLRKTAATLEKSAELNRTMALEKAAVAELLAKSEALQKTASASLSKPWNPRGGNQLRSNAQALDARASSLNRAAALQRSATLEKAAQAGGQNQ